MRIYISGQITGTDDYEIRFFRAERGLKEIGLDVINPAKVCSQLPELTHEEYMTICIPMLQLCDAIYLLDGWEHSKGAREELAEAIVKEKRIFVQKSGIRLQEPETTHTINNTPAGDECQLDIISRLKWEYEEFNQKTGKNANLIIYFPDNRYNLYLLGRDGDTVWVDSYQELTEENARKSIDRLWEEVKNNG